LCVETINADALVWEASELVGRSNLTKAS
jgi:hypothetical protein